MKKFALIIAGGSGSRMRNTIPKQFLKLGKLPVLMHTMEAFKNYDAGIEFVVVLPENQITRWKNLCNELAFTTTHQMAAGGETRFHSVKNGLELIPENCIVFIHDGVRPLISVKTITNCYKTALEKGNALPVIPVSESIRVKNKHGNAMVDRTKYFLVQTPQTFRSELIKKAYRQNYSPVFTDDSSVLENTGLSINLVEGNRENIKITYPEDLTIAECFLGIKPPATF
jgi:2-C-methyl-D-erythritol 4-phosphate cytidylyltransferase